MALQNYLKKLIICASLLVGQTLSAQKTTIYLLPGLGSDYRIFDSLRFDETRFSIKHIAYGTPAKGDRMSSFARKLIPQIDQSQPFILIGVSLGGMLAVELSETVHPEKVILISSAKNRNDLPTRYRVQRYLRAYKVIPPSFYKWSARPVQKLVEPDRRLFAATFDAMLAVKEKLYLKRAATLIMIWERTENKTKIIQIHGANDHTIPIKHLEKPDYTLARGSHMMALTAHQEVQKALRTILEQPSLPK
jgi:pimeloyl-ACP methyl ester carboxylesterase